MALPVDNVVVLLQWPKDGVFTRGAQTCVGRDELDSSWTFQMMDDTLIIVSLEPMKTVGKLKRTSLRALGKSGHHNVP